ncbi:MAG: protease modulator HflC [Armatimonadota bacterium]|nr:protease modulator HflC [Armatimonadota bacterium]MCX7777184.1 protease modulator HflC [Armatimonadota bacterium]MDW8025011.1 protease modulator HflC [Armatimonadota bacterium]
MTFRHLIFAVLILALLMLLKSVMFTLDEREVAIVTRFGKPVRRVISAGLHFKSPVDVVVRFDRRLQLTEIPARELLTQDKKSLVVETFVCWYVYDPKRFLETLGTMQAVPIRLEDIVVSEVATAFGKRMLSSILVADFGASVLDEIGKEVLRRCRERIRNEYGIPGDPKADPIKLVDVRIRRINFPEPTKQSVYERMKAERQRQAKQYRAEGKEQAMKIRSQTDKEVARILAEAYKRAEQIKGEAEAQAMRIYADAYKRDPEFYRFLRTLEAYKKVLNDKTTVILSADSELMKLLTHGRETKIKDERR